MRPRSSSAPLTFSARIVEGARRGRVIGSPTLNLARADVPRSLRHGIYACRVQWHRRVFPAAMHYGPRLVFRAGIACELHIIDAVIRHAPKRVTVEVIKRLRAIRNFRSVELLKQQIARDVKRTRELTMDA